jgi:hypothetical protein
MECGDMCAKVGSVKARNNVSRETSRQPASGLFHVSHADRRVSRESLANAELRKDDIKQILDIDSTGNPADSL